MSDRIILINKGSIEQEGDPYTIYSQPATEFASDFLGKANLISGKLMCENDKWYLVNTGIRIPINYCGGKEGDGTNILLLGSDEPMSDVDVNDSRGLRSDTIMVMHLPEDGGNVQIIQNVLAGSAVIIPFAVQRDAGVLQCRNAVFDSADNQRRDLGR